MAGYGIDSIGSSYAYDPYFMYAYNSPSFMANQTPAASPAAQTNTQTEQSNYVTTPYNTESSSNAGLIAGGLLIAGGAATLIYASKRGNGKGIKEGFKNIWKGITGKADDILKPTRAMKEFNFVAKDGSKVYVKDGKITGVAIKGESTVLSTKKEINQYMKQNPEVKIPSYFASKQKLNRGVTLTEYAITKDGNKYFVNAEGKVYKVMSNGKEMQKIDVPKEVQGKINNIKANRSQSLETITDVKYTYENGGVTYSCVYDKDKGTVIPEAITISGKLNNKATEQQWKAWLNKNSEVDTQVKTLIEKGRVDGVSVGAFRYKDSNGNVLFVNEKGEIAAIRLNKKPENGAQTLKPNTEAEAYNAWLYDNKEVKEAVEKEFKSGLAPDGATFMAA